MTRGAIAAGHDLTARAGADMLRAGGNAFDAAIAALWTACVVEPVLASPAGGGFLMARPADGQPTLFDFFVDTPRARRTGASDFRAVQADFGTALQQFHIGAATMACPGFVPGLFAVHADHGSLPMAELLQPAIGHARTGFRLTDYQAELARIVAPIVTDTPQARRLWAPDGALAEARSAVINPDLAATLETLASDGEAAMRDGALADAVATTIAQSGHLGQTDLYSYSVERRPPFAFSCSGATGFINPPPAAGGLLVALTLAHLGTDVSAATLAQAIDAADRTRHGAVDAAGAIDTRRLLDALGAPLDRAASVSNTASRGTTQVSVVDELGNAVSATVSNGEGNGQAVGGFMLNNMLGEEDVNPGGSEGWRPGRRLASMMAPAVLSVNGATVAIGSGGSNRIRSAMAQVIARIANGASLVDAIEAPRVHVENGHLDFEDLMPSSDRQSLASAFPDNRAWPEPSMFFGGVHAVAAHADGRFESVGDARRAGVGMIAD